MTFYEMHVLRPVQTFYISNETGKVMKEITPPQNSVSDVYDYWEEIKPYLHMEFCRLEVTTNENGGLVYRYYLKEPK